jgi:hypothetical protein
MSDAHMNDARPEGIRPGVVSKGSQSLATTG